MSPGVLRIHSFADDHAMVVTSLEQNASIGHARR